MSIQVTWFVTDFVLYMVIHSMVAIIYQSGFSFMSQQLHSFILIPSYSPSKSRHWAAWQQSPYFSHCCC